MQTLTITQPDDLHLHLRDGDALQAAAPLVGADIVAACEEVSNSNLSKFPFVDGKRVVLKDENGKVKKPPEYRPANVTQYLNNPSIGETVFRSMTKELTK